MPIAARYADKDTHAEAQQGASCWIEVPLTVETRCTES
jgi:hypothetical protein